MISKYFDEHGTLIISREPYYDANGNIQGESPKQKAERKRNEKITKEKMRMIEEARKRGGTCYF